MAHRSRSSRPSIAITTPGCGNGSSADSRRHLVQIARGLVIDLHRRRAIEAAYREALAALPAALNLCLQVRHESEAQGTRRRAKPSQPPES